MFMINEDVTVHHEAGRLGGVVREAKLAAQHQLWTGLGVGQHGVLRSVWYRSGNLLVLSDAENITSRRCRTDADAAHYAPTHCSKWTHRAAAESRRARARGRADAFRKMPRCEPWGSVLRCTERTRNGNRAPDGERW